MLASLVSCNIFKAKVLVSGQATQHGAQLTSGTAAAWRARFQAVFNASAGFRFQAFSTFHPLAANANRSDVSRRTNEALRLRRLFSGACAFEQRGGTDTHPSREAF